MAEGRNKYVLRKFCEDDYYRYDMMWDRNKGQRTPPRSSLPENGLVVGDFLAVGFLALVDCDFGFFCWYMLDDLSQDREKHVAMSKLVQGLEDIAKSQGKKYLFCFTETRSMLKLLSRLGFVEMGNGHLGKRL